MHVMQGVTFACVNAAAHKEEGSDGSQLATFAFRAKDVAGRDGFMAAVAAHKGKVSTFITQQAWQLVPAVRTSSMLPH